MKKFHYVAEINLPSKSAYPLHVLKMCDAFASLNYKVNLIVFYKEKKLSFNSIKKKYNLKNFFTINSLFNIKKNYNFLDRYKLALFSEKMIDKNSLIISRSIITSLYLAFKRKKNILELHHELKYLTKFFFNFRNFFIKKKKIKFILIHKNLLQKLSLKKKDSIVLDDAIDLSDFKKTKNKIINQCVYTGSLLKGKGIEIIEKLAYLNPEIMFNIYGDKKDIQNNESKIFKKKNIIFNNHVDYCKTPKVLKKYKVLLMPYQNKVYGLAKNLELSEFMSPMKMFDYLASGRIILASKLNVYSHILKNNYNSILVSPNNIISWNNNLKKILNSKKNYSYIKKNALITASKYTWLKRAKKIINFYKI